MAEDFSLDSSRIFSKHVTVESLSYACDEFLVRDDDVILVSYPRSASVKATETTGCRVERTVNLPGTDLSVQDHSEQVIWNIRDPRDVATSSYHLFKLLSQNEELRTFGDYLPIFLQGDAVYGTWFDHTLGWMEKRCTGSFLIMSYEELQRSTSLVVKILDKCMQTSSETIASVVREQSYATQGPQVQCAEDVPISWKKLDSEKIDLVVQNSYFTAMKNNRLSSSYQTKCSTNHTDISIPLLRKGISGDWKNHFTVAQSEAFDKVYQEKMSSVDPALFPGPEPVTLLSVLGVSYPAFSSLCS